MLDLIIKNGSCYINKDLKSQDIAVKDGRIVEIGKISEINAVEFGHQKFWVDAIKEGYGGKKYKNLTSNFDFAGPLSEIVLLGNAAIRSSLLKRSARSNVFIGKQQLLYDNKNMVITNLDKANQFLTRDYRSGWEI